MIKVVFLTIFQCFLLTGGQVCFKFAIEKIQKVQITWAFFVDLLTNWWLLASGIFLISATVLWGYILKQFAFSIAVPLTAFTYIFVLLAAIFIFKEAVPVSRWIGVGLIMLGVMLIVK